MCEFCLKHGEGRKWYLQAKNYSDDLLSDLRHQKRIARLLTDTESLQRKMGRLGLLEKAPQSVQALIRRMVVWKSKRVHYGQVLPLEDVERIFGMMNSIVRTSCLCRRVTLGREERCCYAISLSPDGGRLAELVQGLDRSYHAGPDPAGREKLTKEQAVAALRAHEQEGLCHTVWTFQTPFIGGICNCDRTDCLAMRCTVTHSLPLMFRAEYVAEVDLDLCAGCRQCMRVCQFGALSYSASNHKVAVDQRWCYGCGVCRAVCPRNAIRLQNRCQVPAAAHRW
jgi:Pyruvate/2-oxoacid:ferredoxin oxidoreductase delta subunit